jgi:hypothetical protein
MALKDVRFVADCGLKPGIAGGPKSANSGVTQCSKKDRYSITSACPTFTGLVQIVIPRDHLLPSFGHL